MSELLQRKKSRYAVAKQATRKGVGLTMGTCRKHGRNPDRIPGQVCIVYFTTEEVISEVLEEPMTGMPKRSQAIHGGGKWGAIAPKFQDS